MDYPEPKQCLNMNLEGKKKMKVLLLSKGLTRSLREDCKTWLEVFQLIRLNGDPLL